MYWLAQRDGVRDKPHVHGVNSHVLRIPQGMEAVEGRKAHSDGLLWG